jgi:hypothetical protein
MSLKKTSEIIAVGFSTTELAANTFVQSSVDLQLNPLDQEVFVVVAVDLDPAVPDAVPGQNTQIAMSMSSTSRTAFGNLNDTNVLANNVIDIRTDGANHVAITRTSLDTPPASLGYIGIISTSNFFVQLVGTNNLAAKTSFGRAWGYRARLDAAGYAALVQSQVLTQ